MMDASIGIIQEYATHLHADPASDVLTQIMAELIKTYGNVHVLTFEPDEDEFLISPDFWV